MKVTPQMMAKFEKCKSAEEIFDLAKSYNIVINKKQTQDAFELLKSEDVSDEAMAKVTGGWGQCEPHGGTCRSYGTPECGMFDYHGGVM